MEKIVEPAEIEQFSFIDFYKRNGLSWAAGDLFLVGRSRTMERLGEVAAILRMFSNQKKQPVIKQITVVLPPSSQDGVELLTQLTVSFGDAIARIQGRPLAPDKLDAAFAVVRCVRAANLEMNTILELIQHSEKNCAFLISEAALYRADDVSLTMPVSPLPEDTWVPNLHLLAERAVKAGTDTECYIVLDAGEFKPARVANVDLLCAVEHCGVATAEASGPSVLQLAAQAEHWQELITSGNLDKAISEIETTDDLSVKQKAFMRLQMFSLAGQSNEVRSALEAEPMLSENLSAESALQIAMIAESANENKIAAALLATAIPMLRSQELLETSMTLAERLRKADLVAAGEVGLSTFFPNSKSLRHRRAQAMMRERRYDEASRLLAQENTLEATERAAVYAILNSHLTENEGIDIGAVIEQISTTYPAWIAEVRRICASHLEAIGERGAGLALLLDVEGSETPIDHKSAWEIIGLVERGRLLLDPEIDDETVTIAIERVIEVLSHRPTDGHARLRLTHLLSPQVLGTSATPIMALVVMSLIKRGINPIAVQPIDQRPKSCPLETLPSIIRQVMKWLSADGPSLVLGQRIFPPEQLDTSADEVMAGLAKMIEHIGQKIDDEGDVKTLEMCIAVAAAIAPHCSDPHQDLIVLRLAAGALALSGRVQKARDYAEQGLVMAGESPHRQRLAWFAFADIYARLGNFTESLIGMACSLAAHDHATWDQVWYESLLFLRLFRDLNLIELSRPLLDPARQALTQMGAEAMYSYRLETIELQIRLYEYDRLAKTDPKHLNDIIEDVVKNVQKVIEAGDEAAPAAMLLASLLRIAESQGVMHLAAKSLLASALERVGPQARVLIESAGANQPTIDQVVALASQMESARHAEDIGYDVRNLVVVSRRLLASSAARDATVAIYATELLADQAMTLPGENGEGERLFDKASGPAEATCSLANENLAVVTLGLSGDGLVMVTVADGVLGTAVSESTSTFAPGKLAAWTQLYPYGYKDTTDINDFYTSTVQLGLSGLPNRAVIIASTDLQAFPPNLFQIDHNLAGREHRLATAPSLNWLKAVRANIKPRDGRILAWIPDAQPNEGLPTLAIIAERLRESFDRHAVTLTTGPRLPDNLAGADLVIVAAHGGVAEDKRFFRVVADDVGQIIASSAVSGSLADVGVVVLFVCSGGRLDKHPGASTTVGLVKELLNKGVSAVIAPPWPLNASVPPYWLPAFLRAWDAGAPVIDACYEANQEVKDRLGDDPAKFLAMSVYGDPLSAKSQQSTAK